MFKITARRLALGLAGAAVTTAAACSTQHGAAVVSPGIVADEGMPVFACDGVSCWIVADRPRAPRASAD